jgi:hypothetical protein
MNTIENINDIYPDGGFPHIRLCYTPILEDEKKRKEYSAKNIMSIQSILNKRRFIENIASARQSNAPTVETTTLKPDIVEGNPMKFKYTNIKNKRLRDIGNLNVSRIMSSKKSKKSKKRSKN